jgi:hypothetical protein
MSLATNAPTGLTKNLQLPSTRPLDPGKADQVNLYTDATAHKTFLDVNRAPTINAFTIDNTTGVVTFASAPKSTGAQLPVATGPSVAFAIGVSEELSVANFATLGPSGGPLAAGAYLVSCAVSGAVPDISKFNAAFTVFWNGAAIVPAVGCPYGSNPDNIVRRETTGEMGAYSYGVNNDGSVGRPGPSNLICERDSTGPGVPTLAVTVQATIYRLL